MTPIETLVAVALVVAAVVSFADMYVSAKNDKDIYKRPPRRF
jgi:hypothetical protein